MDGGGDHPTHRAGLGGQGRPSAARSRRRVLIGPKPELGVSQPFGRWTVGGSAGLWFFSTNNSYFPGRAVKSQAGISEGREFRTYLENSASCQCNRTVNGGFDRLIGSG